MRHLQTEALDEEMVPQAFVEKESRGSYFLEARRPTSNGFQGTARLGLAIKPQKGGVQPYVQQGLFDSRFTSFRGLTVGECRRPCLACFAPYRYDHLIRASIPMAEQQPFGEIGLASNPEPRCPCVLLVDVSGSMAEVVANSGKDLGYTVQQDGQTYRAVSGGVTRIDLVNEGLRAYHADLMGDSLATQRVEVSVITFGSTVQTVTPFVTAHEFTPPTLSANGETPLGAALIRAIDAVGERKRQYKQNGLHYYRPWIFLITDGAPTDSWQEAAARVKEGEKDKAFALFVVGVEGANFDILKQISVRQPLALKGYSFEEMFVWLSQSQRSVSHSNPGQEDQVNLSSPAGWATL